MFTQRFLIPEELSRPTHCDKLPLVLEGRNGSEIGSSADVCELISACRSELRQHLSDYGGFLLRGFPLDDAPAFQKVIEALGYDPARENPMDTSPRHNVGDRVFTSTDTPDPYPILAHNENCFLHERPRMIAFFCQTEPRIYGETPIFDTRAACEQLPDPLREKLAQNKVRYRRRLPRQRKPWIPNFIRTWSEAFGTENRDEIETMTARHGITCKWHPNGQQLDTEIVVDPLPYHPDTGQRCLNIQGFHRSSLLLDIEEIRPRQNRLVNSLIKLGTKTLCSLEAMPVTILWGDGSPISHADMVELRRVIWDQSVLFKWKQGDLLVLDNFLTAHGRMNVVQPRKILTTFSDLVTIPA